MTTGKANGLCVAYYEAMDCDGESPNANANACESVAASYTRITGETLPCVRPCPCWEEAALQNVTAENLEQFSCIVLEGGQIRLRNVPGSTPGVEGGFEVRIDDSSAVCATRDLPPGILEITLEQGAACMQHVRDRCEAIGSPIP